MEVSLEKIHTDILQLLMDNTPPDLSDTGDISRKILFKSVNYKPKQIEKACAELETRGLVILHAGFYNKGWSVISITDKGIDTVEPEDDWT
jgi:predicted transcriptional regulator